MTGYEEEYYHNIRKATNELESIAESLEAINKTLDKLLQCFLPPKIVINEMSDVERLQNSHTISTTLPICPHCGSSNIQYMYGTITPFNYTNGLQTMSSH